MQWELLKDEWSQKGSGDAMQQQRIRIAGVFSFWERTTPRLCHFEPEASLKCEKSVIRCFGEMRCFRETAAYYRSLDSVLPFDSLRLGVELGVETFAQGRTSLEMTMRRAYFKTSSSAFNNSLISSTCQSPIWPILICVPLAGP